MGKLESWSSFRSFVSRGSVVDFIFSFCNLLIFKEKDQYFAFAFSLSEHINVYVCVSGLKPSLGIRAWFIACQIICQKTQQWRQ